MIIINGKVISGSNVTVVNGRVISDGGTIKCLEFDEKKSAECSIDGDINFDVQVIDHELRIALKSTGNCFDSNLKLDVSVPKKLFKVISAKSSSANIILNEGVYTDFLKLKTQSGNLEANATANNISASAMSGSVSAKFNNIGHINLSASSTQCQQLKKKIV